MPSNFKAEKKIELENLRYNLFTSLYQQAHDVEKLLADKTDEKLAELDKQIEPNLKITNELIKGKVSNDQKEARKKAAHAIQGLAFRKTQLTIAKSDLYKQISERARIIQGFIDMIAFVEKFDGSVPKLEYIEIEGTRYQANELGGIVKDKEGNKNLYLNKEHGKDHVPKKGKEA